MRKNKTLLTAFAVCLASILALGSLAYFTAQDSVSNTFRMAAYDPEHPDQPVDPDALFSIQVYETVDGRPNTDGRIYTDIAPGDVLDKDPTVKNTGKYDQWVRASVTVTKADAWQRACDAHNIADLTSIFGGYSEDVWTRYDKPAYDDDADTLTYVFYLDRKLEPEATATLFTQFMIPEAFEIGDMISLSTFDLTIAADAIQSDNTGDDARSAFEAHWK